MEKNIQSPAPNEFINFIVRKNITYLFKDFLSILTDFKDENLMSDEYFGKTRKKILDRGNDSIREILACLEKFEIKHK